jgi:hypothetical protein
MCPDSSFPILQHEQFERFEKFAILLIFANLTIFSAEPFFVTLPYYHFTNIPNLGNLQ